MKDIEIARSVITKKITKIAAELSIPEDYICLLYTSRCV